MFKVLCEETKRNQRFLDSSDHSTQTRLNPKLERHNFRKSAHELENLIMYILLHEMNANTKENN